VQAPFLQVSPAGQGGASQLPQWALLVCMSTHVDEQQVNPLPQGGSQLLPSPLQPAAQFSAPMYSPIFACVSGLNDAFGIQ